MEVKKSPKADLEGKKSTWLLIGYVFILALMFVAFEWTDRDKQVTTDTGITDVVFEEEIIPITEQEQKHTRDFIRNIRLKQAAELLSKKRYTIAEVADLTGFTNPNNFSTAFKDLYGMPPSIYMEQHLKQDKNKEEN